MQLLMFLLMTGSALALVLGVRGDDDDDCHHQGPPLHATDCCPSVETLISESTMEAIKSCKKEFPMPPPPPVDSGERPPPAVIKEMKKKFTCAVECVFNKTKLLDEGKKIIGDAFIAALTASVDEGLTDTAKAAFTHCFEDATSSEEDLSSEEEGPEKCTSGPRKLMMCIARQMVLNCPDPLATGPMCAEARERITKCPKTVVLLHSHHK